MKIKNLKRYWEFMLTRKSIVIYNINKENCLLPTTTYNLLFIKK